jgi:uncharacterized protein YdhG (YjbR/CyaY superfamily)
MPAKKPAAAGARSKKAAGGFSAEERAAMKERARELKAAASAADGEKDVLAKIAKMVPADRAMAEALHALVKAHAPSLAPRTWYGMPAYARDGQTICFFQSSATFKTRYCTLGFSDKAKLDEGEMWPTAYALVRWTPQVEAQVLARVKRAVG